MAEVAEGAASKADTHEAEGQSNQTLSAETNEASPQLEKETIEQSEEKVANQQTSADQTMEDQPSARVLEGRKWNERDRSRHDGKNSNSKKFKPNNKFDPSTLPETDNPEAIRKQVEFYFSDSNLLTDQFLFTKMEGHANRPIPIDIIHSFKRMRRFQPRSAIVVALKNSTVLNIVDDDNSIQRKEPLSESLTGKEMDEVQKVHEDESMARSVYAKGFGDEEASTQFDIEAFFAKYGSTNSVRLRRRNDRVFKGSVFVEFDNEDTAKAFLALDPIPEYRGKPLEIKSKKEHCDEKLKEGEIARSKSSHRGGRGRNQRNGGNDSRDWRERRDEDAKNDSSDRRHGGKHRGFGSSGRGRGGRGRGGNRHGDRRRRDDPRDDDAEEADKGADAADMPDVQATSDVPPATEAAGEQASRKRGIEEVDDSHDKPESKKVDTKDA